MQHVWYMSDVQVMIDFKIQVLQNFLFWTLAKRLKLKCSKLKINTNVKHGVAILFLC